MATAPGTIEYLCDQLAGLGDIRSKKMFGEYGIYCNEKIVGGFRMTQVFLDNLEGWIGVNVQNFQYRNSPVKMNGMRGVWDEINQRKNSENTTLAYIGAVYKPVDWCALQLDYVFEYADLFKNADLQPDSHTLEMWVNFIW